MCAILPRVLAGATTSEVIDGERAKLRLAAPLVALAPRPVPARPRRPRRDLAAASELPGARPRGTQPRDGAAARGGARRAAQAAERAAGLRGLRAGLARDRPRGARARPGAERGRAHPGAAGAVPRRRGRPPLEPAQEQR